MRDSITSSAIAISLYTIIVSISIIAMAGKYAKCNGIHIMLYKGEKKKQPLQNIHSIFASGKILIYLEELFGIFLVHTNTDTHTHVYYIHSLGIFCRYLFSVIIFCMLKRRVLHSNVHFERFSFESKPKAELPTEQKWAWQKCNRRKNELKARFELFGFFLSYFYLHFGITCEWVLFTRLTKINRIRSCLVVVPLRHALVVIFLLFFSHSLMQLVKQKAWLLYWV